MLEDRGLLGAQLMRGRTHYAMPATLRQRLSLYHSMCCLPSWIHTHCTSMLPLVWLYHIWSRHNNVGWKKEIEDEKRQNVRSRRKPVGCNHPVVPPIYPSVPCLRASAIGCLTWCRWAHESTTVADMLNCKKKNIKCHVMNKCSKRETWLSHRWSGWLYHSG